MGRDVSIVGGSAAGLYAAAILACNGRPVKVYETAARLDPEPRTLIVTCKLLEVLGSAGREAVVNEIREFELIANGTRARVPLRRPDLIIERSKVIRALAREAAEAGAEICLGRRLVGLEACNGGVRIRFRREADGEQEEKVTDTVVGADGAFSTVSVLAGWPRQPTIPLVQAIVRMPEGVSRHTSKVWFVSADTPYFYWLIPESDDIAALGIIGEDGSQTRDCLQRFLDRHGFETIGYQGARIPQYAGWIPVHRKLGEGDIYLAGDAAGQVKVTTVGGIVTGLRGARGIAEAVLNGGTSAELDDLRRELDLHLLIRRALHGFSEADYGHLLEILNRPSRALLGVYTRDETWKLIWRLLVRQPRLALMGVRRLLVDNGFPRRASELAP